MKIINLFDTYILINTNYKQMNTDKKQPLINPYGFTDDAVQQSNRSHSSNQNLNNQYPNVNNYQPNPYVPPPPPKSQSQPIQTQVIKLPSGLKTSHKKYPIIVEKSREPCSVCSWRQTSLIRYSIGCKAGSCSLCLFLTTGIFFFWIPLTIDSCKDLIVVCGRCGHTKSVIPNKCCE